MALTDLQASQIATLLNERNQLTRQYDRARVLQAAEGFLCKFSESGEVIACVEVKFLQWYQAEVLHLTVAERHVGKGHAKALLCEAEQVARKEGKRLLQCTIRMDNDASRSLFEGLGYIHVSTFRNQGSGNNVGVFQKVLIPAV